jgi:ATP-binding cassette subfamily A (ABC1) protein 3
VKPSAIGSTESLSARYAMYEVHFSCRTREELVKIQNLMAVIPGSRMADDVATRFEVPIESNSPSSTGTLSLARLFEVLATNGGDDLEIEFTVERATLESVFLKVIRENDVREEDVDRRWNCFCFR